MTKKLWGSRFKADLNALAKEYSYSLGIDQELLEAEIKVSIAHATMLGATKIVSERDCRTLIRGLKNVRATLVRSMRNQERMSGHVAVYEDIHTFIQATLEKKIGKVAKKLHTARSRNDLVSTSMRIYLKDKIHAISEGINRFQGALVGQAERHHKVIIPGYTHLQRAQVVLIAHHFLAYVEMLERDKSRLVSARERLNECPLGAAALAGSNLPINRAQVARLLGFNRPTRNSLDSVSDRDFVLEVLSTIAILFTHLSRFTEDLILWSSQEFGFIVLHEEFSTGSSLMPHKKNPDILELVRGKTGEAYGNLFALLTTMKGLPLAYNRDMQEDKRPVFASLRLAISTLAVMEQTVKTLEVDEANCSRASQDSFLFATDVLEYLVKRKVPFREAHDIVGNLVRVANESHSTLSGLSLEAYREFSSVFKRDVYDLFDAQTSVGQKLSLGSTKPEFVAKQIQRAKKQLRVESGKLKRTRKRETARR